MGRRGLADCGSNALGFNMNSRSANNSLLRTWYVVATTGTLPTLDRSVISYKIRIGILILIL